MFAALPSLCVVLNDRRRAVKKVYFAPVDIVTRQKVFNKRIKINCAIEFLPLLVLLTTGSLKGTATKR
jgi:hypothetical protein